MSRGSVLPEGMRLAGEIRGQGDLVVAGTIEGPIAIDGHLTIEATGVVRGEVKARAVVLRGTLTGPAVAEETIRLESGARMIGDARAERVSVVEGALLRGRITMTGAQAARRSSAGQVPAVERRTTPGAVSAPTPPTIATAAGIAPRAAAGVIVEPRVSRDEEFETRATGRFVRRSEAPPAPPAEAEATITRPRDRRPPEPVIPGVGRQRARRKDGGMAS
ncbi:bactofilin family protein [Sandaracinus amylolyticus]|uniref:bactofilin family protein n=1 Tax=Sandaracinus amylolyticus TaxID=927083 RepID=UPI001F19B065|nr:polymer-forming cytoskeletal protein [Sandaracinus amylolyticus]UJR79283.1 Hypothetical protein I5071_13160 [Sandaracinus amylolyticus]